MTEITILDFKLSNTFEEYRTYMNAPEQQAMFAEIGVKTFYIGVSKDDPSRGTVMFQEPEDIRQVLFWEPPDRRLLFREPEDLCPGLF